MSAIILFTEQQKLIDGLKDVLAPQGVSTVPVSDPAQFLPTVLSTKPALIIIDVAVANKTGLAHLEELRKADASIANIPVIIGEETGDLMVISRALQFQVADYFVTGKFDAQVALTKIFKHLPQSEGVIAPRSVQISEENKHFTLLLIEDDRFLRDLAIQKFSADKSLTVITAMDGEQGVMLAEKHIPHVILLDILLPGIDGFEVLKRIRSKPQFGRTVIAMLSNFGQREDIDKAMQLGANQFFIKANFTLDEIVDEVKKMLAKY